MAQRDSVWPSVTQRDPVWPSVTQRGPAWPSVTQCDPAYVQVQFSGIIFSDTPRGRGLAGGTKPMPLPWCVQCMPSFRSLDPRFVNSIFVTLTPHPQECVNKNSHTEKRVSK